MASATPGVKIPTKRVWCRSRNRYLNFNPFNISAGMRWGRWREASGVRLPCFAGFLAYFYMMPEFTRRMRYSGAAWQVFHVSHYLVQFLIDYVKVFNLVSITTVAT